MDIGSGTGWPSAALSNFAPHKFIIDNIECASMEGFLQSQNSKVRKRNGTEHKCYIGKEKRSLVTVMNIRNFLIEHIRL